MPEARLLLGDCLERMAEIPDSSVDAIVTDPPYGLAFMGHKWDATGVAFRPETWAECLRLLKPGGHLLAFGGSRTYHRMAVAVEDAGFEIRDSIMWLYGSGLPKGKTQLKPAHEPLVVARRPLGGTVAANVLRYGTGGLNIDGSRIAGDVPRPGNINPTTASGSNGIYGKDERPYRQVAWEPNRAGRWPTNVIHDGLEEPWARFFYCAKASKADREPGNTHPTVKPTALMRYLARLVTPPGGLILDPFMGSGSTGKAALAEGFDFVGIEQDEAYLAIARSRIEAARAAEVGA